ncbi:hypothetical protein PMAC_002781 [Pneumocystis sp. 'macacae']|nr:hypothetical protein PMAC_002781 [Pneumocystis sp. 'macacae']
MLTPKKHIEYLQITSKGQDLKINELLCLTLKEQCDYIENGRELNETENNAFMNLCENLLKELSGRDFISTLKSFYELDAINSFCKNLTTKSSVELQLKKMSKFERDLINCLIQIKNYF